MDNFGLMLRSKKVAIFIPSLASGGAERVMVSFANLFSEEGFSVDLIVATSKGPYRSFVNDNVNIIDLRVGRVIKAMFPLARYLKTERPAALLSAMSHTNIVAILAHMLSAVATRIVISERTTISRECARAKDLASRIIFFLVSWLYPRADAVIAVSHGVAEDLIQFAGLRPSSVEVIYNPFDLEKIRKLACLNIDHPWFSSEQPPVVLAVGRLNEAKDYPTLLRAFARVRARCRSRLLILGEGELHGMLESMAYAFGLTSDDFQLAGFVANPFPYFARCGVYVLSSRWEGLPGALIEAMACGSPVISTDCPSGPREILENGKWGSLIPIGDDVGLANAITSVLESRRSVLPDTRRRAGDFAQGLALEAYLKSLGMPKI